MPTNGEKLACWRDGYALRDALHTIRLHLDFAVTNRNFDDREFWEQMLDDRADLDHQYHLAKEHGCLDGKELDTAILPILKGVTGKENPVTLSNRVKGLLDGTIPILGNATPEEAIELPEIRIGSRTVTPILTPIHEEKDGRVTSPDHHAEALRIFHEREGEDEDLKRSYGPSWRAYRDEQVEEIEEALDEGRNPEEE